MERRPAGRCEADQGARPVLSLGCHVRGPWVAAPLPHPPHHEFGSAGWTVTSPAHEPVAGESTASRTTCRSCPQERGAQAGIASQRTGPRSLLLEVASCVFYGAIFKDSTALGILGHLLAELKPRELERLVAPMLPRRYFALLEDGDGPPDGVQTLQRTFRAAFELAPEPVKRSAMSQFIALLRDGAKEQVERYEDAFVRAGDLRWLTPEDARLAKDHILGRHRSLRDAPLPCLEGIGKFLQQGDAELFARPLLRTLLSSVGHSTKRKAVDVIVGECWIADEPVRQKVLELANEMKQMVGARGEAEKQEILAELIGSLELPL